MIGFFLLLAVQGWTTPHKIELEKTLSAVEFLAIGRPSALRIRGKSSQKAALKGMLRLDDDVLSGAAVFPLSDLDTGIELRNRHMKETYLEITTNPSAEIKIDVVKIPAEGPVPFSGMMSLHGQTKPVKGNVQRKKSELQFEFVINTEDFAIKAPEFMGIKMGKEVEVKVLVEIPS